MTVLPSSSFRFSPYAFIMRGSTVSFRLPCLYGCECLLERRLDPFAPSLHHIDRLHVAFAVMQCESSRIGCQELRAERFNRRSLRFIFRKPVLVNILTGLAPPILNHSTCSQSGCCEMLVGSGFNFILMSNFGLCRMFVPPCRLIMLWKAASFRLGPYHLQKLSLGDLFDAVLIGLAVL